MTRAVVWALVQHADTSGVSYPSIETLARESDSSTRSAKRVIAVLREEGIVVVRRRNHGAAAGRKLGQSIEGATNVYRIDWDAFARLSESAPTTAGTGASPTPEHGPGGPLNRGQPVHDQGPACPRSGASVAPKLSSEPSREPPPAPRGGEGGGAEESIIDDAERRPAPSTDRQWASEITSRYPLVAGALPMSDENAVVAAIVAERAWPDGATPSEIAAAVDELRVRVDRGELRRPVWLRRWSAERGYWPFVAVAREAAAAAASRDAVAVAGRIGAAATAEAERDRLARDRAATEAELSVLTAAEYAELVGKVRADVPAAERLSDHGPIMRLLVSARIRERSESQVEVEAC
ncbi:MAG TPA: hypothetical protein PKC43_06375 [Phycisphaerales bacterium]|nr:hypothetical protein [Phycisphaerales bacterium]HMP37058.1 hypothetical protein [Phycisphaerales bacterium]